MQATPELEPVRFSRLKKFAKSAAHFAGETTEETGPLRKGTAVHSFLLGGGKRVVVYEGRRSKREHKYRDFLAENDGALIMSPSEMRDAEGMRNSVERDPFAMRILAGIQENRIEWDLLGRACAGTPDVVHLKPDARKIGVELKSSVTSHPERFNWQARKMFYHCQCAWYKDGIERTMAYAPGEVDEFYVVAVESTAPYVVTVFDYSREDLLLGAKQNRLWLENLLGCERTQRFPGYVAPGTVVRLSVMDESGDGLEWAEDEAAAE